MVLSWNTVVSIDFISNEEVTEVDFYSEPGKYTLDITDLLVKSSINVLI